MRIVNLNIAKVRQRGFLTALVTLMCVPSGVAFAGDVNQGTCTPGVEASPGFRAYMPDCRAYEMVTPVYKGGASVQSLGAISSDGSSVLVTSFGGFAGIENNEQNHFAAGAGVYRLSRSSTSWTAEPLQPPADEVSHSGYLAAGADLQRTLWELIEEPTSPETELLNASTRYRLALREQSLGSTPSFVPIGRENPPTQDVNRRDFRFQGASADLSHILFSIEARGNDTWPGDATEQGEGFSSLYEYVGTNESEPVLVGVKNAGRLTGSPHINEGAEPIGVCGTVLGSPGASAYGAVSRSGTSVFFTAMACESGPPVNELYARLDEERTVPLSEPERPISAEQGTGAGPRECNATCEAATPAEAVFQGASADGSKVFFTTTQPLLNEDEGGEGTGNDLYEAEVEGEKLTRLVQISHDSDGSAGVLGVVRVAERGQRVYFVAEGVLAGANGEGVSPTAGQDNLYVYNTASATISLVAVLVPADGELWKTEDERRPAQVTATGRFLVFASVERLTGAEDRSSIDQLFEYDAQTGRIRRVSIGQQSPIGYLCAETGSVESGYACNGNSADPSLTPTMATFTFLAGTPPTEAQSKLAVSEDGRVFFMSRDALTPQAVAGAKNIYEYADEDVYLIAPGEDLQLEAAAFGEPSVEHGRLVSTDASGGDLFFGAVGSLVPQDTDTQADVYDARMQGGFPGVATLGECEGADACRGPATSPSAQPGSPASAGGGGEASLPPLPATTVSPPKKQPTAARRLARALRACTKKPRRERRRCRAAARRRYAAKARGKGGAR